MCVIPLENISSNGKSFKVRDSLKKGMHVVAKDFKI